MTRRPVLAGLVLTTLGLVLLFDELGALDAGDLLATWWPLVVVGAGLVQLTVRPRSVAGGTLLVAIGGVLLLWRLDVVDDLALLWPVVLLTLGGWLLLGHGTPPWRRGDGTADVDGEELEVVTVFSDRRLRAHGGPLRGGSIVTVFGDVDLDLSASHLVRRAKVDGVTVFGDVELLVPSTWQVTVSGPTLFGGARVDDADPVPEGDTAPTLQLELVTVFGDLRVRRSRVASTAAV